MKRLLRILGLRALAGFLACALVVGTCARPVGVEAQSQVLTCVYEGGSPTTPVVNRPTFVECDSSHNLSVTVASGSITASLTLPYAGTNGQTLTAASFLGAGALDANGKFSPLQEDASQNLLAKIVSGSTTAVTQATASNLNAAVVGVGTAGTPSGGVVSIQGVGSGTAVPVSGTFFQATQPVSCASGATCPVNATLQAGSAIAGKFGIDQTTPGTTNGVQVNAALPTGANVIGGVTGSGNFTVVQPTGTNLHAVLDTTSTTAVTQATASNLNAAVVGVGTAGAPSGGVVSIQGVGSGTAVPVSGTVTSNIGTTNGLALDTSIQSFLFADGATTEPSKIVFVGGETNDGTPQYEPIPLTAAGASVKVDGSAVTQPVSGTITANAGSGTFATSCTAANCTHEIADSGGVNKLTVNSNGSINTSLYNSGGTAIATSNSGTSIANAVGGTIGVQGITTGIPLPVVVNSSKSTYNFANVNGFAAGITKAISNTNGKQIVVWGYDTAFSACTTGCGWSAVYGTGTNCGTGTVTIQSYLYSVVNVTVSKVPGSMPLFVLPASQDFCWNVTGAAASMFGGLIYTVE